MNNLGLNIKYGRNLKGLSQGKLAKILGVSNNTISNWENGISFPPMDKLVSMSNIFNLSTDDLLKNNLERDGFKMGVIENPDLSNKNLMVPSSAQAGYAEEWSQLRIDDDIKIVDVPGIRGEARTFEVVGDSMEPLLIHGDWAVCKRLENVQDIIEEKIYVVVSRTSGITIKFIRLYEDGIKCFPFNTTEYNPSKIEHGDIGEIWEVKVKITKHYLSRYLVNKDYYKDSE